MVAHYYQGERVEILSHIADSIYLVGLIQEREGLVVVWNEQTNQKLFTVYDKRSNSIKRVLSSFNYIFNTDFEGVHLLTIKDLASNRFSLHHLFEADNLH
jgi:hypothetical protein